MIVGLIPARGGSKRLPRKNVRELLGRPLVAWTISAARQVQELDRVVVSTDDAEVASIACEYGADVILRPPELATDDAPMEVVVEHAAEVLGGASRWVLLQPTSPLRPPMAIAWAATEPGAVFTGMTDADGAVYGWDASGFLPRTGAEADAILCLPRWQAVDIDTLDDWAEAEAMAVRHGTEITW